MQRSPSEQPPSLSDTTRSPAPNSAVPYCLGCGYERIGIESATACPECGTVTADDVHDEALMRFRNPLQRALAESRGRIPLGWWCLLSPDHRLAARVQLVKWLTLSTLALLLFFAGGAHIRLWFAAHPIRVVTRATEESNGTEAVLIDNAILSGLLPGDLGWARTPGARPFPYTFPVGQPPSIPRLELVKPDWTPFFIASVTWAACLPAAGLLGLRFILFPLALRVSRRSLGDATRQAAGVAADATVASAAITCTATTIGWATLTFLLSAVLPNASAMAIVRSNPMSILGLLLLLPPLLVSVVVWHDRARRVFAWPKLAAAMTFVSYFIGVALAIGAIAATFSIAVRVLA